MDEAQQLTPQISYLISLSDQLVAVWQDLGGDYLIWDERNIHRILFERKRTSVLRDSWSDYPPAEAQVCISFLRFTLLRNYQAMLNKRRDADRAVWQRKKELRNSGMDRRAMEEFCLSKYPYEPQPAIVEFVDTVDGIEYFVERPTHLRLWGYDRAYSQWRSYHNYATESAPPFPAPLFETMEFPGFKGKYYCPLFDLS